MAACRVCWGDGKEAEEVSDGYEADDESGSAPDAAEEVGIVEAEEEETIPEPRLGGGKEEDVEGPSRGVVETTIALASRGVDIVDEVPELELESRGVVEIIIGSSTRIRDTEGDGRDCEVCTARIEEGEEVDEEVPDDVEC